ncbi:MAG TPA: hypothetical protein PK948_05035 [Gemmatimonadales bacterium]|nr:hypothetical protein [Gemmatimonadales bacterium]
MARIRVRPHQLPPPTWRCWFHGFPPREEAVFVYDLSDRMVGMLCGCGSFRWPRLLATPPAPEAK